MKNISKAALLRSGVAPAIIAASLSAVPAYAQEAQADGAGEVIVVTGSRIQRRDIETAAPITVVGQEEFKLSGAVNVEQVVNTLPQVIPGTTAFSNNPGGGVATLDLRGLGSTRTSVLVNGRRWMFYDTQQVVDLNTIPQFLIESVDVVTGGAGAVYGSDALAGVVNFRLRTNLQGFEGGSQYSITDDGDGARFNANVAFGADIADGRGHVTTYASYFKRKAIFQGARGFSRQALGDGATGLVPLGSATVPQGRIAGAATVAVPAGGGLGATTLNLAAGTVFAGNGAYFSTPGTGRAYTGADAYNYAPDNYLQVPQERWLIGGYGEYEISDAVTAYTEVSFVNNRVQNELAPTPVTGSIPVNIANNAQYLSPAMVAQLQQIDANETAINAARTARGLTPLYAGANAAANAAGVVSLGVNRRVNEVASRNSFDERNAFRALLGFRGPITDTINYDANYFYSRTRNANIQTGNISRSGFNAGVLNGTINIWGADTLTPAMVDSISILAQNNEISTMQVASANINGTLFNLGMGAEDIGFALGTEYRKVSSQFIPDTALSSGDVVGFNAGDPTAGSYDVKEVFAEVSIPIVADQPFFHKLTLTAAGRYSDYSLQAVGGVWTYAGGIEWAPIQDITLRGQYQRAVRAPNVGELFGGQSQGFPPATDPCALASALTEPVRSVCIATGVPAAQVGQAALQPNTQIQGSFGGNPNLSEETSDSYTFGAVVRPSFVPGLTIKADYYNIKIENVIAVAGGGVNNILNLCYNTIRDANSAICQLINRDPNTGIIGDQFIVQANNANLASRETSGIDFSVDYTTTLPFSLLTDTGEQRVNFAFLGTWTEKYNIKPIAELDDTIRCAGRFGLDCGDPFAKFKWTSRLTLIDGPLTTSLRWRHLNSVRDDDDTTDYIVEKLPAYNVFDLSFAYDIADSFTLSLGMNNIFNKTPYQIGNNQQQANTYPSTYDVLGRDMFVAVNFRF